MHRKAGAVWTGRGGFGGRNSETDTCLTGQTKGGVELEWVEHLPSDVAPLISQYVTTGGSGQGNRIWRSYNSRRGQTEPPRCQDADESRDREGRGDGLIHVGLCTWTVLAIHSVERPRIFRRPIGASSVAAREPINQTPKAIALAPRGIWLAPRVVLAYRNTH